MSCLPESCNGDCCLGFVLPYSLEMLKRKAQHGIGANGSAKEMRFLADMVVPLQNQAVDSRKGKRFAYTCKHLDLDTRKCAAYEKRPSLCRTYPDNQKCADGCYAAKLGIKGVTGCGSESGTGTDLARDQFKKAHGIPGIPEKK